MYRCLVSNTTQSLLMVAVLMIAHGHISHEAGEELLNCNISRHEKLEDDHPTSSCSNETTCNLSIANVSLTIKNTRKSSCLFFACLVNYNKSLLPVENTFKCILYNCTSESDICDDPEVQGDDKGEAGGGDESTVNGLIALVVILIVFLLVAAFVIVTMVLMIRDMQNERIENGLPNPYSCIFTAVRSIFTPSEEPPKKTQSHSKPKKQKEDNKPKKQKEDKKPAPKHYSRKDETAPSETENPDPDEDDYEEMDHVKRGSFTEGDGDDVYQNY